MMKQKWFNTGLVILVAIALFVGAYAITQSNRPEARGSTHFGAAQFSGDVLIDADIAIDDTFKVDDTIYILTDTQTLTPTASYYIVQSASAVTITLATGSAASGDFLYVVDKTSQAVVFVDTGATAGGGNRTLGNHDVIGFIFDGSMWVESFYSDNS